MKKLFFTIATAILFVLILPAFSHAADWPNKKVNGQNNPVVFDAANYKPSSLYNIQINYGDSGYAYPIAADDKLFYTITRNYVDVTLVAANIHTGQTVWSKDFNRQILNLIYDNGKLYFGSGFIYCLNSENGSEIWRVDSDIAGNAIASSGVYKIDDGRLYAYESQTAERTMLIINSNNGDKISNVNNLNLAHINEILFDSNNFYTFYGYGSYGYIRALNKTNFGQMWSSETCQTGTTIKPLLDQDKKMVYMASEPGRFCVYQTDNGAKVFDKNFYFNKGLVEYGDRIYGFLNGTNGVLESMPMNDFNAFGASGVLENEKFSTDPIMVNDTLYGGTALGRVYGKNLETGESETWSTSDSGGYIYYLAYANGKMIIVNRLGQFDTELIVKDINDLSLKPSDYTITLDSPYNIEGHLPLLGQLHAHYMPEAPEKWALTYGQYLYSPYDVEKRYKDAGYDFIALTEHNQITPDPEVSAIMHIVNSEEDTQGIGGSHILSLSIATSIDENLDLRGRINQITEQSGLAIVAHPDSWVYPLSADLILNNSGLNHMEGFNSAVYKSRIPDANAFDKADNILEMGKIIYSTAGDDYTPDLPGFDGGAVVVFSETNTQADILQNLKNGNFYALQGSEAPRISIFTSGNQITINSDQESEIKFIGNGGKELLKIEDIYSASYVANGDENYVRAEITAGEKTAWTQPIKVNKTRIAQTINAGRHYTNLGQAGLVSNTTDLVNSSILSNSQYPVSTPPFGYLSPVYSFETSGQVLDGTKLSISYADKNIYTNPSNLSIYSYSETNSVWDKIHSFVNTANQTVTAYLPHFSLYTLSADQPVDTENPQVDLISPDDLSNLAGSVELIANVTDNNAVVETRFIVDDKLVEKDINGADGWTTSVIADDYSIGDHVLKIEAEDFSGNIGTFETNFTILESTFIAPEILINTPQENQFLNDKFIISGNYSSINNIKSMSIFLNNIYLDEAEFINGVFQKEIDSSQFVEGQHILKVVLADAKDNVAESEKTINVGEELKVEIISPLEQTYMHSDKILFRYSTTPENAEGAIAKLDGDKIENNSIINAYDLPLGQYTFLVEKDGKVFAESNFIIDTNLSDQRKLTDQMYKTGHIKNKGIATSIKTNLLLAEVFEKLGLKKFRDKFIKNIIKFIIQHNKQKKPLIDDYARDMLVGDLSYLLNL